MIDGDFFSRKIICNPVDQHILRENILADDIILVVSNWLEKGKYLVSKDIECEPKMQARYDGDDFEKNKITIIVTQTFK